jgi:hypothetical protein
MPETLDFSQGGRLIKDMEEFIPYLNVGVQGHTFVC